MNIDIVRGMFAIIIKLHTRLNLIKCITIFLMRILIFSIHCTSIEIIAAIGNDNNFNELRDTVPTIDFQ